MHCDVQRDLSGDKCNGRKKGERVKKEERKREKGRKGENEKKRERER